MRTVERGRGQGQTAPAGFHGRNAISGRDEDVVVPAPIDVRVKKPLEPHPGYRRICQVGDAHRYPELVLIDVPLEGLANPEGVAIAWPCRACDGQRERIRPVRL